MISTMALMEAVYYDILSSPELTVTLSNIKSEAFFVLFFGQSEAIYLDQSEATI